jgi:hypothetical protein
MADESGLLQVSCARQVSSLYFTHQSFWSSNLSLMHIHRTDVVRISVLQTARLSGSEEGRWIGSTRVDSDPRECAVGSTTGIRIGSRRR